MLCALNGQHTGQPQFIHLASKERNGFKAGFRFRRAACKRGIIAQTVIVHQIAERETVTEQHGFPGSIVHHRLIFAIQSGQLFQIGRSVSGIDIPVGRVDRFQCIVDSIAESFSVLQGQPDVFIVLRLIFVLGFFLLGLHAFHDFFLFYLLAQHIQQVNDLHILIGGFLQGIFHPAIRLTADINEQIAVRDFDNIVCGRLVAVQIHAIVQQHGKLGVIGFIAEDFAHPVILREDGRDDFQGLIVTLRCRRCRNGRRFGLSAAAQNASSQQKTKKYSEYTFEFFHRNALHCFV